MPMKAVYDTFDGEIVSETRNGVRKDYLPDPLGSTVALMDASHTKTESASYWPYGEQRGTSTLSTPFGYVGTLGYYTDDTDRVYVRARTLLAKRAMWLTVDPLWPDEKAYGYVAHSPISRTDRSGTNFEECLPGSAFEKAYNSLKGFMASPCRNRRPIADCWKKCGEHDYEKEAEGFCKHATGAPGYGVDFACYSESAMCNGDPRVVSLGGACMGTTRGSWHSNCRVRICPGNCDDNVDFMQAIFHEMMHCQGASHSKQLRGGVQAEPDCLEDCLRGIVGWPTRSQGWRGWPTDFQNRVGSRESCRKNT